MDFSWEAIPLVETFITGLMAAVVTAFIVLLCSMVFKWGNSRMRRCAVARGGGWVGWKGVGVSLMLPTRQRWAGGG